MTAIRQRVPFRFSEDEGQEDRILDEQEQEELIDNLRQQSASSNAIYLVGLQAVIGLSLLLHILYVLRSPKRSPLAALFPDAPSGPPVPLATALAMLQITLHCNLSLTVLPSSHPLRRAVHSPALPPSLQPPIPLSHLATILLPVVAPLYALLLGQAWTDVLWWGTTAILTGVVAIALKWMKEEEVEIAELEKLRYVARGA